MTTDDLLKGKVICYRCITMVSLFILIVGTAIYNAQQAQIGTINNSLLLWLTVVLGACLYFAMANRAAKLNAQTIEIKDGKVMVLENGQIRKTELLENINVQYTSWTYNNRELRPAVVLRGPQIGTVRIATSAEEHEWIHVANMVRNAHYMVESKSEWSELLHSLDPNYLLTKQYNPLT